MVSKTRGLRFESLGVRKITRKVNEIIRSSEGIKKKVFYTQEEIDYFLSFDEDNKMYLIPIKEISTQECRLKQFTKYIVG